MFISRWKAERKKSLEALQKLRRASHYFRDFTLRYLRVVHVIDIFLRLDWATSCIVMIAYKRTREFSFRRGNEISLTTAGRSTTSVRYHNGCSLLPPYEYSCLAIGGVLCFSLYICFSYLFCFYCITSPRRFFLMYGLFWIYLSWLINLDGFYDNRICNFSLLFKSEAALS